MMGGLTVGQECSRGLGRKYIFFVFPSLHRYLDVLYCEQHIHLPLPIITFFFEVLDK